VHQVLLDNVHHNAKRKADERNTEPKTHQDYEFSSVLIIINHNAVIQISYNTA